VNSISLNKVLDILEEHDFIEQIDQLGDERSYRFTHHFMNNTLTSTLPFPSFKQNIHEALTEFHRSQHPSVTLSSDQIKAMFLRQLLLQHRQLLPEHLEKEQREGILKKEIDL
jgi:hypothetical protein